MKRLIRINEPGVPKLSSEEISFEDYSYEELEILLDIISKELSRRRAIINGKVEVHWEAIWKNELDTTITSIATVSKKPYLAKLKPNETRRYDFEFLKLSREYIKTDGSEIKFIYNGFLEIGTVLKGRVAVGEDHYYKVVLSGLKIIYEMEAIRILEKMKKDEKEEPK